MRVGRPPEYVADNPLVRQQLTPLLAACVLFHEDHHEAPASRQTRQGSAYSFSISVTRLKTVVSASWITATGR
jgi:hypothetical protein